MYLKKTLIVLKCVCFLFSGRGTYQSHGRKPLQSVKTLTNHSQQPECQSSLPNTQGTAKLPFLLNERKGIEPSLFFSSCSHYGKVRILAKKYDKKIIHNLINQTKTCISTQKPFSGFILLQGKRSWAWTQIYVSSTSSFWHPTFVIDPSPMSWQLKSVVLSKSSTHLI